MPPGRQRPVQLRHPAPPRSTKEVGGGETRPGDPSTAVAESASESILTA
uniref:TRAF3 interacting protein 3 n=1 Tax=Pipistrellus kuhlii TaxID=59472 RepID=A0A7J7UVC7_PIPKU|nr:TRAF3 interacting protein 3 [Pipistrellus kuhlii]